MSEVDTGAELSGAVVDVETGAVDVTGADVEAGAEVLVGESAM
jgi:hypothetical protein